MEKKAVSIIGIDPGPKESGVVRWDGCRVTLAENWRNEYLCEQLHSTIGGTFIANSVAIEDFIIYRPLDRASRETIKAIGAIREAARGRMRVAEIPRHDVLRHFCGTTKGGDSALRAALVDRFGGSMRAAKGTRLSPGPLFGISGHLWAALGVALCAADELTKEKP